MSTLSIADFLANCKQFRTTLTHAGNKAVREWNQEALKNAFGWAEYIQAVMPATRPPRLPARSDRASLHALRSSLGACKLPTSRPSIS